mgnify:CR=1 FL=1
MEQNRRKCKRWNFLPLKIYNNENKHFGNIRDISTEGIGLIIKHDIETSKNFSLKMHIPETLTNGNDVDFTAKSVWCQPVWSNRYTAGFEYINADPQTKEELQKLINKYGFDI